MRIVYIASSLFFLLSCGESAQNSKNPLLDYDYTNYALHKVDDFGLQFKVPKEFALFDFDAYRSKIADMSSDLVAHEALLDQLPTDYPEFVRFVLDTVQNSASIMIQCVDFTPISKQLAKDMWRQMKESARYDVYDIEFLQSSITRKNDIDMIRYEMGYTHPNLPKHYYIFLLTKGKKSFAVYFLSNDKTTIDPFIYSIEYL